MGGLFITLEGTEGGGKSTQCQWLTGQLESRGFKVRRLREPGGTTIGEEIRHTLISSAGNSAMTPEAELLLMNASRAQLVREVIRPALAQGEIVVCDRFYDSTTAYQGHGRQLELERVKSVIDVAVGWTRPDLTLLLHVPLAVSEQRRQVRQAAQRAGRDRMEEADREFFRRVEQGFLAVAHAEPGRVKLIDATADLETVQDRIWEFVEPLVKHWVPRGPGD